MALTCLDLPQGLSGTLDTIMHQYYFDASGNREKICVRRSGGELRLIMLKRYLMWIAFAGCGFLVGVGIEPSAVQADTTQTLMSSLSLDKRTNQRAAPSATAIKAYIAGGYVGRKPDIRFDYTDYRKFRKPAQFFGYTILVIEEEYMAEYVGCCVSPGLGLVLSGKGDPRQLSAFAQANGCSVEHPVDLSGSLGDLRLGLPSTAMTRLSCRERDVSP